MASHDYRLGGKWGELDGQGLRNGSKGSCRKLVSDVLVSLLSSLSVSLCLTHTHTQTHYAIRIGFSATFPIY